MDQIAAKAFVAWVDNRECKGDLVNCAKPLTYLISPDGKSFQHNYNNDYIILNTLSKLISRKVIFDAGLLFLIQGL